MEQFETQCVLQQMGCINSLLSKDLRLEESNEYTFLIRKKKLTIWLEIPWSSPICE